MRDDAWKLIYVQDYGYALYNLETDLGESSNVIETHPDRAQSMKRRLNEWKKQMPEPLWGEGEQWFRAHTKNHVRIIEGQ